MRAEFNRRYHQLIRMRAAAVAFATIVAAGVGILALAPDRANQVTTRIETHDNIKPAGRMEGNELRVALWAGLGKWNPSGAQSAALDVAAFGEEGASLLIPSPLIRVRQNTVIRLSLRNALRSPLRVYGLCDRPGPCNPVAVPPGDTRELRVTLGEPGTFHYWATTGASSLDKREGPDSHLGGAIVVDPPGATAIDRVFVLGLTGRSSAPAEQFTVVNGRSWPHTERLTYAVGDTARWRMVNLTTSAHAMHLHGFYFRVDSVGDGVRDTTYAESDRRMGVTEQMPPGRTMTMTWVPERPGNWLFHCHMLVHMMDMAPGSAAAHAEHGVAAGAAALDPAAGMAGLVLGIQVTGPERTSVLPDTARRRIQLRIDPDARNGNALSYRVSITGTRRPAPRLNDARAPGPVMVLERGEPVAVDVINGLREPTAIHWHGIELESYDDGVPGFGGAPAVGGKTGSVTPPVQPGGTFTARFTPPRAGTFIYHTHWHDAGQLAGGIYGPLIVLDPGESYDPATDHIVVLGLDGVYRDLPDEPFAVNGERRPRPLELKSGVTNRLRFINITADNVALTVQMLSRLDPIQWTLLSKDAWPAPPAQRTLRAARQLVSVGETYDFEIAPLPAGTPNLWMELRRGSGELLMQWPATVR